MKTNRNPELSVVRRSYEQRGSPNESLQGRLRYTESNDALEVVTRVLERDEADGDDGRQRKEEQRKQALDASTQAGRVVEG